MKRIATPMVGVVVTSTLMELFVYPTIFFLWRSRSLPQPSLRDGDKLWNMNPGLESPGYHRWSLRDLRVRVMAWKYARSDAIMCAEAGAWQHNRAPFAFPNRVAMF